MLYPACTSQPVLWCPCVPLIKPQAYLLLLRSRRDWHVSMRIWHSSSSQLTRDRPLCRSVGGEDVARFRMSRQAVI